MNELTKDQREFFIEMMDHIRAETTSRPSITNMDVVVILSRMIGMAIAKGGADRETMRRAMLDNVAESVKRFE